MLDFYAINDNLNKNTKKTELKLAGKLDEKSFYDLQNKKIIEDWLDYYADFRWTKETVKQKIKLINDLKLEKENSSMSLLAILKVAEKNCEGIIAFSD